MGTGAGTCPLRAAGSLWKRIGLIFLAPPPEHQLTARQVRTIFTEYLLDRPFTLTR